MIRSYAIAALLALSLVLGGMAWRWQARATRAEDALASATARLQQVSEANAVHRGHLDRLQRQQAAYDALQTEFETMEGADAPLSDYLRRLDGRLR